MQAGVAHVLHYLKAVDKGGGPPPTARPGRGDEGDADRDPLVGKGTIRTMGARSPVLSAGK